MKVKQVAVLFVGAFMAVFARSSGFGLYEASVESYALGGCVMGRAVDASANFFNPATLTDLTNVTVTMGFLTEHPRGRIKVGSLASCGMDPGAFWLPHFQLAMPLPWNLAFGLGLMPEYGLGSEYDDDWSLANNSLKTTVMSFTLNPNLAWRITRDLSVGLGMRFLYFDFEQHSNPFVPALGSSFSNRLKGNNGMRDFGYQVGIKYEVTESFSVGATWKSWTLVHVKGRTSNDASDPLSAAMAKAASGGAETELELPQSVTFGCNWEVAPSVRLGGSVAWTQWSSVDVLGFDLARQRRDVVLEWVDTLRAGVAAGWDFADDWTMMGSYVYETDCCGDQESTMLPAADRHMLSVGLTWHCCRWLDVSAGYGMIIMDGKDTQARDATGALASYRASRGLSHAAGLSLTFRF